MDELLSAEQRDLCEATVRFARRDLARDMVAADHAGEFWAEGMRKVAGMSILGLPFPEEHGGCGQDAVTAAAVLRALAYGCEDGGLVHAVTTQMLCGLALLHFGTPAQRAEHLPSLLAGEKVWSQAITEPGSGSDAMAMATHAVRDGESWILSGSKTFITNAPVAAGVIVFAVTDPARRAMGGISAFLVPGDATGLARGRALEKMGLRTLPVGELFLSDCRLPASSLLGKEGQGGVIFNELMEWERVLVPATHLGTLRRVLERTVAYARTRKTFGEPISRHPPVARKMVAMKEALTLGDLMLHRAASLKAAGKRAPLETSLLKLFVSERLKASCLDAVQVHGAYGYCAEYGVERDLRDAVAATIYSGTSEMQERIVARLMGL